MFADIGSGPVVGSDPNYDQEQVAYENPSAGVTLAGTLTRPSSGGPHPAAVLITGSGPHDRDETVFGHRPFLVLADHLTRHGLAVLRVDDRGVGESTGDFTTASTEDFASDVEAGVDFLQARTDIRGDGVGLIGHSDGAIIGPLVAAGSRDVAWIVMLAGTGVPGEELLLAQADRIAAAMGVPEESLAQQAEFNRAVYAVVKEQADDTVAKREIEKLIDEHASDAEDASTKQALTQLRAQIPRLLGPWFRGFLESDPGTTLRGVRVPVLAMNGELDLQVPAKQNLPAIVAALEAGGNRDYTAVKLPGLNHLFQTALTGSPEEYEKIEETIAPVALRTISDWLARRL
jgi:uncharacterized protein